MGKMGKLLTGSAYLLFMVMVCVVGTAMAAAKNETSYEKDVKKILAERCLSCHGSDAPTIEAFKKDQAGFKKAMKGPRTDTYANLMVLVNGSDTGALMRRLDDGKNTKDGKSGNMYQYLGGTDQERAANLSVFKNWVGGWTLKRKADITEEERKTIMCPEK